MGMGSLPKTYQPGDYEDSVYKRWESAEAFRPASDKDASLRDTLKPYTIIMPPPNATARLHTGHAIMVALEDALIRYHRMKGFDTLYLPGTDHAAIATASMVDKQLLEEKVDKQKLGREKFAERAKQFAEENKKAIEEQVRALGASADWSRNAFTMDTARETAVNTAFRRLYEKELIYRGDYMVNWCPHCLTVLSDDEVEHHDQEGVLYYLKYGPFELATTRPETKVGDTAVAVHPKDKRYKELVGQTIDVEMINGTRKVVVVADDAVDPEFGTGAVKVTPFHDKTDYQIGQRHDLPAVEVIGEDGKMTEAAGKELAGLDRFEARKKVVKWLKSKELLIEEKLHPHSVGRCYRCSTVIEPRISKQWFIDVSKIKTQAIQFVTDGDLKFVPQRYEKTYLDWFERLHDWCISRQVWFGHPVPVYLKGDEVSLEPKPGFEPSTDTLDTWFSSGLWPFSTMGWPEDSDDFRRFFPNDVLETGYDIILFWIVRMVVMTVALDVKDPTSGKLKPPFHTAFLHGLVRDKRGRKFSKTLGNGVDPLELIGKYGADALRFMLSTSTTPGNDVKFDEERVIGARNFANKLWNISRFVIERTDGAEPFEKVDPGGLTSLDRAILHRLKETADAVRSTLHDEAAYGKPQELPHAGNPPRRPRPYDLAYAGNSLYEFIWSDYADWYLEAAKVQLEDPNLSQATQSVLKYVLETVVKLLHPFMPFITETIWQDGLGEKGLLTTTEWPELHEDLLQPDDAAAFGQLKEIVETIRRLRSERKTPPGNFITALLISNDPTPLEAAAPIIKNLARIESLSIGEKLEVPQDAVTTIVSGTTIALPLEGLVDAAAEQERLQKELAEATLKVERLKERLGNKDYASKAPKQLVDQTKADLAEAERAAEELARLAQT